MHPISHNTLFLALLVSSIIAPPPPPPNRPLPDLSAPKTKMPLVKKGAQKPRAPTSNLDINAIAARAEAVRQRNAAKIGTGVELVQQQGTHVVRNALLDAINQKRSNVGETATLTQAQLDAFAAAKAKKQQEEEAKVAEERKRRLKEAAAFSQAKKNNAPFKAPLLGQANLLEHMKAKFKKLEIPTVVEMVKIFKDGDFIQVPADSQDALDYAQRLKDQKAAKAAALLANASGAAGNNTNASASANVALDPDAARKRQERADFLAKLSATLQPKQAPTPATKATGAPKKKTLILPPGNLPPPGPGGPIPAPPGKLPSGGNLPLAGPIPAPPSGAPGGSAPAPINPPMTGTTPSTQGTEPLLDHKGRLATIIYYDSEEEEYWIDLAEKEGRPVLIQETPTGSVAVFDSVSATTGGSYSQQEGGKSSVPDSNTEPTVEGKPSEEVPSQASGTKITMKGKNDNSAQGLALPTVLMASAALLSLILA